MLFCITQSRSGSILKNKVRNCLKEVVQAYNKVRSCLKEAVQAYNKEKRSLSILQAA